MQLPIFLGLDKSQNLLQTVSIDKYFNKDHDVIHNQHTIQILNQFLYQISIYINWALKRLTRDNDHKILHLVQWDTVYWTMNIVQLHTLVVLLDFLIYLQSSWKISERISVVLWLTLLRILVSWPKPEPKPNPNPTFFAKTEPFYEPFYSIVILDTLQSKQKKIMLRFTVKFGVYDCLYYFFFFV